MNINIQNWWRKNGYKVMGVILFPVWLLIWGNAQVVKLKNKKGA